MGVSCSVRDLTPTDVVTDDQRDGRTGHRTDSGQVRIQGFQALFVARASMYRRHGRRTVPPAVPQFGTGTAPSSESCSGEVCVIYAQVQQVGPSHRRLEHIVPAPDICCAEDKSGRACHGGLSGIRLSAHRHSQGTSWKGNRWFAGFRRREPTTKTQKKLVASFAPGINAAPCMLTPPPP